MLGAQMARKVHYSSAAHARLRRRTLASLFVCCKGVAAARTSESSSVKARVRRSSLAHCPILICARTQRWRKARQFPV